MRKTISGSTSILILQEMMLLQPTFANANPEIVEVALAGGVNQGNRQPFSRLQPPVSCENRNGNDPIIYSNITKKVFLWNQIRSEKPVSILHKWYKEDISIPTSSSFFDSLTNILRVLKIVPGGTKWGVLSTVRLNVGSSIFWKTWSLYDLSKNLSPTGKWKIEIVDERNPSTILCLVKFEVKVN